MKLQPGLGAFTQYALKCTTSTLKLPWAHHIVAYHSLLRHIRQHKSINTSTQEKHTKTQNCETETYIIKYYQWVHW